MSTSRTEMMLRAGPPAASGSLTLAALSRHARLQEQPSGLTDALAGDPAEWVAEVLVDPHSVSAKEGLQISLLL